MSVAGIQVDGGTARGSDLLTEASKTKEQTKEQSPAGVSDPKSTNFLKFYEFEDFESFVASTTPMLLAGMLVAHALEVALLFLVRISRR